MSWIFLAAGAQFINAFVAILDKYIVTDENVMPRPFVYAFYSLLFTGAWALVYIIGLIPLPISFFAIPSFANVESPSLEVVALATLAAYTFFIALVSMYSALKQADASDVMPVVGAVAAISSFGLGYVLLDQQLTANFIWGIFLLASGTFLVSQVRFTKSIILNTVHSGIFFALHLIAMKGLFNVTSFDNGFFWSRLAFVLFALTLLLVPSYLEKIKLQTGKTTRSAGLLVMANKLLAGVAAIMLLKATELGEVSVVQALDGLKFVFILLLGIFFGHRTPPSCGEESCRRDDVIQKAVFVALISLGFLVLFG